MRDCAYPAIVAAVSRETMLSFGAGIYRALRSDPLVLWQHDLPHNSTDNQPIPMSHMANCTV